MTAYRSRIGSLVRVVSGLGLGALGGFAISLLRRRPQSSYVASLRAPVAGGEQGPDGGDDDRLVGGQPKQGRHRREVSP